MSDKTFYVTSPIYYVNAAPHIGHAYTTVACDVMARWKRLDDFDVKFLTGTDEHGQKVETSARNKGVDPQTFTDEVSQTFRDLAAAFNISNDDFIRTTEERHKAACQALWNKLLEKGDIYLGSYSGWYSVSDEAYHDESELTTREDGTKVAPSGHKVEWVEEASYFFRLSAWGDRLLEHYAANPDAIEPQGRRNEVLSFIKGGLRDLSISRTTFSWGVKVPVNAPGDEDHIMYVWLDALTNYLTSLGYPDTDGQMQSHWPADLHIVGKDILRFHAVYWPAFLMAADLAPPARVFAHGWWTNEGQKISKSLGNVIDPYALKDEFGLDQVRYFMMREVPFGNDADYSRDAMITRMNSDLANAWGNLAQRVLSMIGKNCGGLVPQHGELTAEDLALAEVIRTLPDEMRGHIDAQAFKQALEAAWRAISAANVYVDEQAPWKLRKEDPARMETVLYVLLEAIRQIAILLQPFMPESHEKMLDLLAVAPEGRTFAAIGKAIPAGAELPKPSGVFPRHEEPAAG